MSKWIGEVSDSEPNGRVQVPIVIVNDGVTRADPIADLKVAGDVVVVVVVVVFFFFFFFFCGGGGVVHIRTRDR